MMFTAIKTQRYSGILGFPTRFKFVMGALVASVGCTGAPMEHMGAGNNTPDMTLTSDATLSSGVAAGGGPTLPVSQGGGGAIVSSSTSDTDLPTGGTIGGSGGIDSGSSGGASAVDEFGVQALLSAFDVFWDFEGESQPMIAPSVGSETLTQLGSVIQAGPVGQQLSLLGEQSSAVSVGPVIDTSADFSVSAWVKLDKLNGYDTFVAVDGEQVSAFYLQKRSDNRLSFATFPTDSSQAVSCVVTGQIQPSPGEWYFMVATRSAATREQRLYVDGVLSGRTTCPAGVFAAGGGVSVGRALYAGQPSDFMQGAVDDVGMISRLLQPEEIIKLYRAGRPDASHYLFAYFVEVSQGRGDGLRFAHSHDGLTWGAIGDGKVFMPPSVGGGSFRDPHVMRDPKGVYHLVWTTSCVPWAEANCVQDRGMGHATSTDLVTWSQADYIQVDLNVEHVWAPETYYDDNTSQYMVFWSSPIDQDPSAADPHKIFYLLTSDFQSFSAPEVLYAQDGRNFIDATIAQDGDGYLMIIKDEADGQKNLRALRSPQLFGAAAWVSSPSSALTGNYAAEGPSLLERDGERFLYFDKYGEGSYGALRAASSDSLIAPASWQDISSTVFFPGVRHGTPISVPWEVFQAVALEASR